MNLFISAVFFLGGWKLKQNKSNLNHIYINVMCIRSHAFDWAIIRFIHSIFNVLLNLKNFMLCIHYAHNISDFFLNINVEEMSQLWHDHKTKTIICECHNVAKIRQNFIR